MSTAEVIAVEHVVNNTIKRMTGNRNEIEVTNLESFLDGLETALNLVGYQVVPSPIGNWYTVIESK